MKPFNQIMKYSYRLLIVLVLGVIIWKCFQYFIIKETKETNGSIKLLENVYQDNQGKIRISVFYEALCSDSRFFILKQLVPAYEALPGYITLDLVPYGKAQTIEKDGVISFTCQHGNLECLANKIHACSLQQVTDPDLQLKYIACMINDNMIPRMAGEKCAQDLNINYEPIAICADGLEASVLLKAHGERTHALNPPVSFIPTIELNGSQKVSQALLLKNLKKELCNLLIMKPNECL